MAGEVAGAAGVCEAACVWGSGVRTGCDSTETTSVAGGLTITACVDWVVAGAVGTEGALGTEVETGRGIGITGRVWDCVWKVSGEEELELTP